MTAPRMLPRLTDVDRPFWTGGAEGKLLVQHCAACDRWQHPPAAGCRTCEGPVEARPVSGDGTVFTFTVNHQPFHPEVPPPYVIAVVTLVEQDDLRLVTNLVDVPADELRCGLPVTVRFEPHDGVHVPLFGPRPAQG